MGGSNKLTGKSKAKCIGTSRNWNMKYGEGASESSQVNSVNGGTFSVNAPNLEKQTDGLSDSYVFLLSLCQDCTAVL